jgi:low affinity Fe/Cu permease
MEIDMHPEHAELISALRRENERLTIENAKVSELQTIIDAQDRMLGDYEGMVRRATNLNDQLIVRVRELNDEVRRLTECP